MSHPDSPMFAVDAELVRQHLDLLHRLRATGDMTEPELREFFLSHTLGEWYSCLSDGMDTDVGHLLYWLTGFIESDERRSIQLYPGENAWKTVETWRQEWERMHPEGIPQLPANELEIVRHAITAG